MQWSSRRCRLNGSIVCAATVYFAVVFVAGFLLGTIRVLVIVPLWGELPAVLLETPVMLLLSWFWAGSAIRRYDVQGPCAALATGAAAFALLMAAELALSALAFGRSPAQYGRTFGTPAGAVGLAGQVAFGLMPLLRFLAPRGA